jgi:tRNA1Val (adenine37-N6)-methyltransferase
VSADHELTSDTLFCGALRLTQPARGYRINIDSLLLADFAAGSPGAARRARRLVDLGAGVGALALALDHLAGIGEAVLVERDPALAELARHNLAAAGLAARIVTADLAARLPRGLAAGADLVVANPPFFEPRAGRESADPARRRARFGGLAPFLTAAAKLLSGPRGRACFCYPACSLPELLAQAAAARLVPKRLRLVHAAEQSPARLALIELRRARPGGLVILPPLLEWSSPGVRSPELGALIARPAAAKI